MTKSKKPSIQSISRDDFKFLVTWKPGEKSPSKQVLEYAVIKKEKTFNKAKSAAKKDKKAKGVKYHSLSGVDKNDKKAHLIIDKEDYYPSSTNLPVIEGIEFRLANKSKKETLSDYDYKVFDTDKPPKPKVEISVDTGQSANRAYISIAVPNDTPNKPVTDVYYQYAIVDDYNGNPQDKKYWEYWNMGDNFKADMIKKSKNIGPIDIDNTGTKTLICHAKTRGMAGDSDEVWAVHQFTEPYKATNLRLYDENSVTIDEGSQITRVKVAWDAPTGAYNNKTAQKYQSNPIDQTTVQYYIGTPEIRNVYTKVLSVTPNAKLDSRQDYYIYESNKYHYVSAPNATDLANDRYYFRSFSYSAPNNAGFTDAQSQVDTKDDDYAVIIVPQVVGLDSCLWLRVVTKRDTYDIPSDPLLVYKGNLTIPTIGTITPNQSTYKATVSVTNNSTVPGSFIALIYRDKTGSEDSGKIIGVIPSGETSVQVQCPNWTGKTPISFGAYAIFGEINYKNVKETPVIGSYSRTADTVIQPNKDYYIVDPNTNTYVKVESPVIDDIGNYYEGVALSTPMVEYAFDEVMSSEVVYKGGEVPVSPTGIKLLSSVDDASIPDGSIQVTWDVPWLEANGAEISWADHEDAWYSTNGPSTHELELIEEPKLNISGLETGKKWYVRVRLYKESGDNKIYSLYSATYSKDLSMAPDKPVLNISPEGIITRDTEITASWVYISNDGTQQSYGRLEEVIDGEDNIPIGQSSTQQFISFKPSDKNVNWEPGTSHKLVLYVGSASGQYSEESSSVQIDIAEPIEASIVDTSLIKDKMEINVELYSGTKDSIVQINNPNGIKDVTSLQVALEPVQDNDYDSVWSGGNGKNKLATTESSFTQNGVTFTVNNDGSIKVTGTASLGTWFYFNTDLNLPAGSYVMSGGSEFNQANRATGDVVSCLDFRDSNSAIYNNIRSTASDASFTLSTAVEHFRVSLSILEGKTANFTFYPMIRESGTSSDWQPYENKCPITGHDSVGANVTGVNQWDEETADGYWYNSGTASADTSYIRSLSLVPVLPNTQYYFKAPTTAGDVFARVYDKSKTNGRGFEISKNNVFTTPSDVYYLGFALAKSAYGTTYNNDISINYPATDHDYHAYTGSTYTATLPQTVYGGNAELVGGTGKSTMGMVDAGTLDWQYYSTYNMFYASLTGRAKGETNLICSAYPVGGVWAATDDKAVRGNPSNEIVYIKDTSYGTDAATFKAAMNGVQLVYELATPTDLTFTPQSITLNEGTNNVWSEQGDYVVRTAEWSSDELLLKNLPLDMTVTGGGMNGEAMVTIKRAEDFHTPRPDDPDDYRGYRGDTIFEAGSSQPDENGNYHISISLEDLNNAGVQFDDGAEYQIITTVSDSQNGDGQIAVLDTIPDPDDSEAEHFDRFFVDWTHQAVAPSEFSTEPEVQVDDEYGVAIISTGTPVQSNYEEGDSIDIYRLSADAPMLIYKGAQFNSSYVDPYPTIGKRGGYRLVYVTNNGDYIDNDNIPAWTDYEGSIYSLFSLIDFRNRELEFKFNVDYDWTWTKPFTMTHYLGGGIEGDWTDGTEGSGNIKGNVIDDYEPETYDLIRDLATHNNICHVRTLEGSNFTSNVQVSDSRSYKDPGHLHGVSLSITRVDNPFYDAIPLDLWEEAE